MKPISESTRRMAYSLAVQAIAQWRKSKAQGLVKSAGMSRRYALVMISAYKTGLI